MPSALHGKFARTVLILSFFAEAGVGHSAAQNAVCSAGFGSFKADFATGVSVSVGAVPRAGFAARACRAKLGWGNQDFLVEADAWQVDVDAMGIDLGLGSPVAAFQITKSDADPVARYEIYSLRKPPSHLRTITGGSVYTAADSDLDGRIEVWTNDADAIKGFDNIPLAAFDFVPTVVLRFERRKLLDVSAEFESEYNRQMRTVRGQILAQDLRSFKQSDGVLSSSSSVPPDQLHRLLRTKIGVLEIVWAYLYSNRKEEALNNLRDMWPAADFDRIRAAILNARAHGLISQVDGVSETSSPGRFKKKHAMIYDRISDTDAREGNPLGGNYAPGASGPTKTEHTFEADTYPIAILLRRPPPQDGSASALGNEVVVNLVIDAAGKVRSATAEGKPEMDLLEATAGWKFIPAFKSGHAVASRLQMGVTPLR